MTETENGSARETLNSIDEVRRLTEAASLSSGKTYKACVVTFGCQMNARDSEKLKGICVNCGYQLTDSEDEADLILYNTCTVRENANTHVYGRLGKLVTLYKKNPSLIVGLCGCMMQEEHVVEKLRKSFPVVRLVFGTHNLYAFPSLLLTALREKKRVFDIKESSDIIVEDLPAVRKYSFKSGLNIMYGCDNFCTYCIVPYVRGREKSRSAKEIIKEAEKLAEDGVVEIMLLGQNVNSYGKKFGEGETDDKPLTFAGLLRELCKIEKLKRIRFMTSHPKDLSNDLIRVMAEEPKICKHLHLPVQSGSTKILGKMNRHYSREDYLALVRKIRESVPDMALTTDIIVGFPGETEEDFAETLSLIEKVGYDSVFTFIYSKRSGTPAAGMEDQVPDDVCHERFERLLATVKDSAERSCGRYLGRTEEVLVDEQNKDKGLVTGRTGHNMVVHFPGTADDIGRLIPVCLDDFRGFYYFGSRKD